MILSHLCAVTQPRNITSRLLDYNRDGASLLRVPSGYPHQPRVCLCCVGMSSDIQFCYIYIYMYIYFIVLLTQNDDFYDDRDGMKACTATDIFIYL